MKKSSSVAAPLLASVAMTVLSGCRQEQLKRIVDEHNVLVYNPATAPGDLSNGTKRAGFGAWFLIAAFAGVAVALSSGE